jgi:hypothetical protein
MDARDVKCGCCRRATLNEDALRISAWECPDCHWINPLPGEPITAPPVPAPGDVLAWAVVDAKGKVRHVDLYAARANSASWPGDTVVPLGRLAARPTPMTDDAVKAMLREAGFFLHTTIADRIMGIVRAVEAHHGIAHPSPAGAGDDATDTTTRETR